MVSDVARYKITIAYKSFKNAICEVNRVQVNGIRNDPKKAVSPMEHLGGLPS